MDWCQRTKSQVAVSAIGVGLVVFLPAGSSVAAQQVVEVPSGQTVNLTEVLVEQAQRETWVRFRFVAPQIAREGGDVTFDTAASDIDHLCQNMVVPYLNEHSITPERVVISMSDRDVPFGQANPEATQFFEAYRLDGADCIWEEF